MANAGRHYYSEWDADAAAWLRELIRLGEIPDGDVDTRSITEVHPSDLRGYTQCHFFAGIAGWPFALKLAGWPADKPCWTGSPPCQGFSSAGAGRGFEDERHLWPVFHRLIDACRPTVVFGEQVASSLVVGKSGKKLKPADLDAAVIDQDGRSTWIDLVQSDLEDSSYASVAFDLPSAGFGSPHIRQRIMFVAARVDRIPPCRAHGLMGDGECAGLEGQPEHVDGRGEPRRLLAHKAGPVASPGAIDDVGDAASRGHEHERHDGPAGVLAGATQEAAPNGEPGRRSAGAGALADANCLGHDARLAGDEGAEDGSRGEHRDGPSGCSGDVVVADARSSGREVAIQHAGDGGSAHGVRQADAAGRDGMDGWSSATSGFWSGADWLHCRDGKWRPVEGSLLGVADGLPADLVRGGDELSASFPLIKGQERRTMRLKGYGNAINPHQGAAFIQAYMEAAGLIIEQ